MEGREASLNALQILCLDTVYFDAPRGKDSEVVGAEPPKMFVTIIKGFLPLFILKISSGFGQVTPGELCLPA